MCGRDVIMMGNFYQMPLVQNSWIFSSMTIGFNIITSKFLHENFKCYELQKIMRQNDVHFISILNRFRIVSQTNEDIHFMNDFYLRSPPMDNTLPQLFYANLKTNAHNKIVYNKTPSKRFKFLAKDIHYETCFHFKLSMLPSHTSDLHHELLL
jgi:hypothetical protein